MSWTTPTLVEICIGLEVTGYLPAEYWLRCVGSTAPRYRRAHRPLSRRSESETDVG